MVSFIFAILFVIKDAKTFNN